MMRRFMPMFVVVIFALAIPALAQLRATKLMPVAGGGNVQLPYTVPDSSGTSWMIYNASNIQQQGNMVIYSGAGAFSINGNQPQGRNMATLDEKTGEIVFENLRVGQFVVTRRLLINKEDCYVRCIEVIKNTAGQDQNANLMIASNLNYGINTGQFITDPKKKDQNMAWVAQTGANRAVMELWAGKGSKIGPNVQWQQGNSYIQASFQLNVPAGKEVAIMHLHGTSATQDSAAKFVAGIKETKLMATIPQALRKIMANFVGGQSFIGDYEVLRGEMFDVVEMKGGDQLKGTLQEKSFKLTTFYGPIELAVDRVVGIVNVGDFRPRQLLVTVDGEIFGGRLAGDSLKLELSSGQTTAIPLGQISRVGYRKRAGEPEEWPTDKPLVLMRSGDRIGVQVPTADIDVVTRYGTLKLPPKAISAIVFQSEEHGVHDVLLADGSKFAALVNTDSFSMKLAAAAGVAEQTVKFPTSAMGRLQLAAAPEVDDKAGVLALLNNDQMVGRLSGQLKLETAFDTITISAGEIRKLTRGKGSVQDVQVQLWDDSQMSGQLQDPDVTCQLAGGMSIKVPVGLIGEYNQPLPQPSPQMIEKIKKVVESLNADDWQQRDRAQADLVSMGVAVIGVLKELRPTQPPEAQERIDGVIKQLEKQLDKPKSSAGGIVQPMIMNKDIDF